jgi:hypothetical protein
MLRRMATKRQALIGKIYEQGLHNLDSLPSSNIMRPITKGARLCGIVTRSARFGTASEFSYEN